MRITFVQTADSAVYSQFINVTSATVKEICARQGHAYECFIGIKRGAKPWHAALNRLPILKSYVDQGYDGWVIYLDADAYVADVDFDIVGYLSAKSDFAMIAAGSGLEPPRWWDINNGVFAINLGHPQGRMIAELWNAALLSVPEDELNAEQKWGDVIDDQAALHKILRDNETVLEPVFYRDDAAPRVFNWYGSFIRQYVRETGDFEKRLAALKEGVAEALNGVSEVELSDDRQETPEQRAARYQVCDEVAEAIYRGILNREPDEGGLDAVKHKLRHRITTFENEFKSCISSVEFERRFNEILERARQN